MLIVKVQRIALGTNLHKANPKPLVAFRQIVYAETLLRSETKLVRSGFLRELKERDLRIQMAELERKYKNVEGAKSQIRDEAVQTKRVIEPGSVTEGTTFRLRTSDQEESK